MSAYFMFNAISALGLEHQRTLLRADMVDAPEYNVFGPKYAITRFMIKGQFADRLCWSFMAVCRNLPPRKLIEAARQQQADNNSPALVRLDASGQLARLYFYEGGAGMQMRNLEKTTPAAYARQLVAQGHQVISFPRPSDYKTRYGMK